MIQKRARLASHPECFHNGIILIVYVIQKSCAKVLLFSDMCKYFGNKLHYFVPNLTFLLHIWEIIDH